MTLDAAILCAALLIVLGVLVWARRRAPHGTSQERDTLDAIGDDLIVLQAALESGAGGVGERTVERMRERIRRVKG